MTKIFIDTNIFLGLYETNNDPITIFKDISKLKSDLIFPDQVYDEFIRNRDRQLVNLIDTCEKNNCIINSSSMIRSLPEFKNLKKIQDNFKGANKILTAKLQEMKDDTNKDPVIKSFLELYNDPKVIKYERNHEIIRNARERKLLGNPPVGYKQDTIGDEVIWETMLSNLKDDLNIITLDRTYEDHITFLKQEFKSKTGKELSVHENISSMLKTIGEEPSEELNKFEEERLSTLVNSVSSMWSEVYAAAALENLARTKKLFEGMEHRYIFKDAAKEIVLHKNPLHFPHELAVCPQCKSYRRREGNQCLSCGYKYANGN